MTRLHIRLFSACLGEMNRRKFLKNITLAACSTVLAGSSVDYAAALASKKSLNVLAGQKRPNILYIMMDEWGYYELSCMGHPILKTPNIDRMAAEGKRFTQCMAGGPVCAPTRSVLMTGQHLGHTTVRSNAGGSAAGSLRDGDVTIAQVLKQADYATGGFGKWGLGDRGTTGVPEKHGFDTFYGYYHQVHAHSYFPRYLVRNSEQEYLPGNTGDRFIGETYSHYRIFEEAKKFIVDNKDRPFFCYCAWTPPHGHWGMPSDEPAWRKYKDKIWTAGQSTQNDAKVYAAMIEMVDCQIGELLAMLKELGLDDNTIVVFSGDNGGQRYFKNFFGPNDNPVTGKTFRGEKGSLYEGGLRVPYIVRWPGKVAPSTTTNHLCHFSDVMPTLAELAGVKTPDNIDGISFVPTLLGESKAGRQQQQHKYLYWEYGKARAVRMEKWKAVRPKNDSVSWQLYDLSTDIEESNNVADENPSILKQMINYANQAHVPRVSGKVLDPSVAFDKVK